MYRLAKLLGNDLVNCSELLELFLGFFAYNGDIRAEIRKDLNAVRVPSVPNRSYVETLLYSQGFLALQAHKVAHKLWSGYSKKLPFYSTGLTFAEQYSNCFTWKSQRWQWKATVLYQWWSASSQGRRASRRNQPKLSSSANILPPTGGQLIQSDGQDSTNSTQVASSPLSIAVRTANNTGRASASSGNCEDGTDRPPIRYTYARRKKGSA